MLCFENLSAKNSNINKYTFLDVIDCHIKRYFKRQQRRRTYETPELLTTQKLRKFFKPTADEDILRNQSRRRWNRLTADEYYEKILEKYAVNSIDVTTALISNIYCYL